MIKLHPIPDVSYHCPFDNTELDVLGWYIPGMRNLVDLFCPQCHRQFYGDLLSGQALYSPMLLEKATGVVYDSYGIEWFARWLRDSYAQRVNSPVGFTVEERRTPKRGILLNCLDRLYGHSLLKLLNAQYYLDHYPDFDLVVLVPRFLRWMVPEGVAAIWTVDLPLKQGIEWNEWLAHNIHHRVELMEACHLSVAFSHPYPEDYAIERFTRVPPFAIDEWESRLEHPTITFIWREDRVWNTACQTGFFRKLTLRMKHKIGLGSNTIARQAHQIVKLASKLRQYFPYLDFAIVGLGQPGGFPEWITDLRTLEINEQIEVAWCKRYAQSHVVVGVHGSSMLLPSAHAGATIELMPVDRWGNMVQDILFHSEDVRETLFRCRILPISISPEALTWVIISLLKHHHNFLVTMQRKFCDHNRVTGAAQWSSAMQQHFSALYNGD